MTVARMDSKQPIHIDVLRPMMMAVIPALAAVMNAPKVMSDEMSCWRSDVMFHPMGVFGSGYPKTYWGVST